MTWTYSGDPSTSDKDFVRFTIQDTDSTDQLLQDEEIQFLIDQEGTAVAAWKAAETISGKFSRFVDTEIGDYSAKYSQRVNQFRELAIKLKRRASLVIGKPFAGGISVSDKEATQDDTDRVKPIFSRHLDENPKAIEDNEVSINGGAEK